LNRFRLSCEDGSRKQSMKLAVPEFKRNLIDPLSDDISLSVADLVKSTSINFRRLNSSRDENFNLRSFFAGIPFDSSLENLHSIFLCRHVLQGLLPSHPSFMVVHCNTLTSIPIDEHELITYRVASMRSPSTSCCFWDLAISSLRAAGVMIPQVIARFEV